MLKRAKKGQMVSIDGLLKFGIFVVILGVILAFGAKFVADQQADIKTEYGVNSTAYLVLNETLAAQGEIAEAQTPITQVIVLGIILSVLIWVYVLYKRNSNAA